MLTHVFWLILIAVSIYVFRFGDRELRTVLAILNVDFILTPILFWVGGHNWLHWPVGVLVLDTLASLSLLFISLRSKRFWPLPIASLMIIPALTPIAQLYGKSLISSALGWAQGLWSYVQFAILVSVARQQKRLRHET